jgi:hypothetical protein
METANVKLVGVWEKSNLLRVDVVLQHVPADLLGLAFHLKLDDCSWVVKNVQPADQFSQAILLYNLVKTQNGVCEVVVGLTQKHDNINLINDGLAVSFFLNRSVITGSAQKKGAMISFSNQKMFVLRDGAAVEQPANWGSLAIPEQQTQESIVSIQADYQVGSEWVMGKMEVMSGRVASWLGQSSVHSQTSVNKVVFDNMALTEYYAGIMLFALVGLLVFAYYLTKENK